MKKSMKRKMLTIVSILYVFNVSGGDYVNPVGRLAEYNLNALNEFAKGDSWTAIGKLFQWGRNMPISTDESAVLNVVQQVDKISNVETWEEKFIVSPNNSSNWYNGGGNLDIWKAVVNQSFAKGAPISYLGENDGDPSPKGYHVPTVAEFKAIIFTIGFTQKINSRDKSENRIDIDGRGVFRDYIADYENINPTKTVALRFKGTSNVTAFKYEWHYGKGLEVSAKQVFPGTTIEDIAASEYDWSDAVVRQFPICPQRDFSGKYSKIIRQVTFHTANSVKPGVANVLQLSNLGALYLGRGRSYAYPIRSIKD